MRRKRLVGSEEIGTSRIEANSEVNKEDLEQSPPFQGDNRKTINHNLVEQLEFLEPPQIYLLCFLYAKRIMSRTYPPSRCQHKDTVKSHLPKMVQQFFARALKLLKRYIGFYNSNYIFLNIDGIKLAQMLVKSGICKEVYKKYERMF